MVSPGGEVAGQRRPAHNDVASARKNRVKAELRTKPRFGVPARSIGTRTQSEEMVSPGGEVAGRGRPAHNGVMRRKGLISPGGEVAGQRRPAHNWDAPRTMVTPRAQCSPHRDVGASGQATGMCQVRLVRWRAMSRRQGTRLTKQGLVPVIGVGTEA